MLVEGTRKKRGIPRKGEKKGKPISQISKKGRNKPDSTHGRTRTTSMGRWKGGGEVSPRHQWGKMSPFTRDKRAREREKSPPSSVDKESSSPLSLAGLLETCAGGEGILFTIQDAGVGKRKDSPSLQSSSGRGGRNLSCLARKESFLSNLFPERGILVTLEFLMG